MNWGEGLKRISAVFWGVVALLGVWAGIATLLAQSTQVEVLVLGIAAAALAYPAHKYSCKLVAWVVEGFTSPRQRQ